MNHFLAVILLICGLSMAQSLREKRMTPFGMPLSFNIARFNDFQEDGEEDVKSYPTFAGKKMDDDTEQFMRFLKKIGSKKIPYQYVKIRKSFY